MAKKHFYAVVKGRKPGIYREWDGEDGAESQISGFPGAIFKGFSSEADAQQWFDEKNHPNLPVPKTSKEKTKGPSPVSNPTRSKETSYEQKQFPLSPTKEINKGQKFMIYTDGSCLDNPGNGGYGVVILHNGKRQELSGGYAHTTNNRMELTACIVGLERIPSGSVVELFSDSQYVVNGIKKGWAKRWRSKGWYKSNREQAENIDLWAKLLDLCEKNQVEFIWIQGHNGDKENERCNQLAQEAAGKSHNPIDAGYQG